MDPQKNERELEELLDRVLQKYSEAEPSWGFEERILAKAQEPTRGVQGVAPRRWWMWWPAWAAAAAVVVIAAVLPLALRTTRQTKDFETKVASNQQPAREASPYAGEVAKRSESVAKRKAPTRQKKNVDELLAKSSPRSLKADRADFLEAKPSAPAQLADLNSERRIYTAMKTEATAETATRVQATSARKANFPVPSPMTAQERALLAWASSRPRDAEQVARSEGTNAEEKPLAISEIKIEPLKVPEIGGGSK